MFSFNRDVGIDLGTANTLVYLKGKGVVSSEPSVVAIEKDTGRVMAVGNDAKLMIGRVPGHISVIRPMSDGVIADFDTTTVMLRHFINVAVQNQGFLRMRPRIMICVPSGITEVEKRAVEDAAIQAGAKEAFTIEETMAAAIGAGLLIHEALGSMIVDIGGGTTEVAIMSLGGVVVSRSIRVGGDKMDRAIMNLVKQRYNVLIGERTAETVKIKIGSAMMDDSNRDKIAAIRGRDLVSGLPKTLDISAQEVCGALAESTRAILDAIKSTLEKCPPELASDIINNGIAMTGGGSMLYNLDKLISQETGIPVIVAENALESVVLGTGKALEHLHLFEKK